MLQYGFYAWSWSVAGKLLARLGFGAEYEVSLTTVRFILSTRWILMPYDR